MDAKRGQRVFKLRVNPTRYGKGIHRVNARVVFKAASRTSAATLRLSFQRCARQVVGAAVHRLIRTADPLPAAPWGIPGRRPPSSRPRLRNTMTRRLLPLCLLPRSRRPLPPRRPSRCR